MKSVNTPSIAHVATTAGTSSCVDLESPATMAEVVSLLRRAADSLEAAVTAIPAPLAPKPLPLSHPARTTRQYAPTDWPRLIPRNEEPTASKIFDSPEFRKRFHPGEVVEVYIGGGEGYKRLSRTLCLPTYKVGTTALFGIKARFSQHKADKYGSFWCDNGQYVEELDFADQFPSLIRTGLTLSPASPVRSTRNSIVTTLPASMSQLQFEEAFKVEIDHCAIYRFLQSDEGLRHCRLINVDPQVGLRMTAYGSGAGRRMSPADEIYTIRPMFDGDAMLTVVERIILRHLGLVE